VTSESAALTPPLITQLEEISRVHPQRVLRLRGVLRVGLDPALEEPFELLIYRGFSSSTTHPTAFDPDQPVLPGAVAGLEAELLAAPLNPAAEQVLVGPAPIDRFLDPLAWS
jgi:hypothetical protein